MADEKWICPLCGQEATGDTCAWCYAARPVVAAVEEIKEDVVIEEVNEQAAVEEMIADAEIKEATDLIEETDDLAAEFGADDLSQFEAEMVEIEEEAEISEDLEGFAKGFPDWDLHPPKK